jgi:regulator of protease activity HflC (stomatin/prohibitin superfamily)
LGKGGAGMTELDKLALVVGIAALLLVLALLSTRQKLTLFEWQSGLLYRNGIFKRALGPGTHRLFAPPNSWLVFDRRPQFITLPGQEVLTRDALGLKVTLTAEFQIEIRRNSCARFRRRPARRLERDLSLLQIPIREAASTYTLEEIVKNRDALPELVRAAAVERLGLAGIKLIKVAVRDIMIAKELRDAYAASAIAQKTSAATLERARGEVAAMRALANAARMAQGNPELMQLRALQAMQTANGARQTIVFDFAGKSPGPRTGADVDIGPDVGQILARHWPDIGDEDLL